MSGRAVRPLLLVFAPAVAWFLFTVPCGQDALAFATAAELARTVGWADVYPDDAGENPAFHELSQRLEPSVRGNVAGYVAPPMGVALVLPLRGLGPVGIHRVLAGLSLLGAFAGIAWLDARYRPREWISVAAVAALMPSAFAAAALGQSGPLLALAPLAFVPGSAGTLLGAAAIGVLGCLKGFPLVAIPLLLALRRWREAAVASAIPGAAALAVLARWGTGPFARYAAILGVLGDPTRFPSDSNLALPPVGALVARAIVVGVTGLAMAELAPRRSAAAYAPLGAAWILAASPVIWRHYAFALYPLALPLLCAGPRARLAGLTMLAAVGASLVLDIAWTDAPQASLDLARASVAVLLVVAALAGLAQARADGRAVTAPAAASGTSAAGRS